MNIRQQKYKSNRLLGMNMYNAAIAAGYSPNTARNAYVKLKKVEKGGIYDVLDRAGLTDKAMSQALQELTKAVRVISCNVFVDKDGNIKDKNATGKSLDFIEVPDNKIRKDTWELIAKLKKHLSDKMIDLSRHEHHTVIWEINGKDTVQTSQKSRAGVGRQESL